MSEPGDPVWKERALHTKGRLDAARAKVASIQERLRQHERAVLRPEVLAHLLPSRAAWRRSTPPDPAAVSRELAHLRRSPGYARAQAGAPPEGAVSVAIAGVTWWVPSDGRRQGRLADRLTREGRLPLADILRTREAISNGVMLDIGANIGLTSILRVLLGDADLVYAAEPAPDNFACLVRNAIDNGLRGLVLPDQVAISNERGESRLRISSSIGGHALRSELGDGIIVQTESVDSWIERLNVDPAAVRYVKVDTQGYECHVLEGASSLLARPGIVWELECSPRHLARSGRSLEQFVAQLQSAFTHFVDVTPQAPGDRVRPIGDLPDATRYLDRHYTNLLVYRT